MKEKKSSEAAINIVYDKQLSVGFGSHKRILFQINQTNIKLKKAFVNHQRSLQTSKFYRLTLSGIYIHIPFCSKRCNYCSFFFITNMDLLGKFVSGLHKEIEMYSSRLRDEKFDTIYFGGGTPSVMSHRVFEGIINSLCKHFNIEGDAEISMESNPEDFLDKSLYDYSSAGINRISFGVQSFKDDELKFLTRNHTAADAESVIRKANEYFRNINIDIIYSLPNQTIQDIDFSLSKACSLNPTHISAYTLTFEERTPLYKSMREKKIERNPESSEAEHFEFVSNKLIEEGFEHYEISNFAKRNFRCRHNLKYWNYENYLGIGPAAHSLLNGFRSNNIAGVGKYNNLLEHNVLPVEETHEIGREQMHLEYVMLSLRSTGIKFRDYSRRFEEDFSDKFRVVMDKLITQGFAVSDDGVFKLTEKGYCVADEIIAKYF